MYLAYRLRKREYNDAHFLLFFLHSGFGQMLYVIIQLTFF